MKEIIGDKVKQGETDCINMAVDLVGELSEREINIIKYAYAYGMTTCSKMDEAIKRVFNHGHV